ncbi:MAG: endonuclease V [Thermoguttaceae bacterium]|jgi:deoxyribonuclease V
MTSSADLPIPDMAGCLRRLLAQVPAGRVTTPGALAAALGNPVAARWVGHYLLHHAHEGHCPCYRVVRAGGRIPPAAGATQAEQLRAEGIKVHDGTVDLEHYGFEQFACDRPLERLSRWQRDIVKRVRIRPRRPGTLRMPRLVGGVDVSYAGAEEGVAAYCLVDTATGGLAWSATVRRSVRFPYISSYLSFRELPVLLDLLAEVRAAGRLSPVVLVDGTGILHPRHAGIASHLGVLASVATVGVTKKLLCGEVRTEGMRPLEARLIELDGRPTGIALRPTAGSRRAIYVSPGHGVDLASAERLAGRLLLGHRLPEPLYWADRVSRRTAKGL